MYNYKLFGYFYLKRFYMKNYIFGAINILLLCSCAVSNIPVQPSNSPSAVPSVIISSSSEPTSSPIISTSPSIEPSVIPSSTASPTPNPSPSISPELNAENNIPNTNKDFKIEFSNVPSSDLNIYLNNLGNGLIVRSHLIKKVENFVIQNTEYKVSESIDIGKTSMFINDQGNGFIIWGSPNMGCIDECIDQNNKISFRKITNYLPTGDEIIIDQGTDLAYPDVASKIDNNGNGLIIWSKGFDQQKRLFAVKVENSIISGTKYEYQDILDIPSERLKSVTGNPVSIYLSANNNVLSDVYATTYSNQILLSNFSNSIKANPAISLNKNGSGLVVWLDSRDSNRLSVYGRYLKNYIAQ